MLLTGFSDGSIMIQPRLQELTGQILYEQSRQLSQTWHSVLAFFAGIWIGAAASSQPQSPNTRLAARWQRP